MNSLDSDLNPNLKDTSIVESLLDNPILSSIVNKIKDYSCKLNDKQEALTKTEDLKQATSEVIDGRGYNRKNIELKSTGNE